ncbi:MAG TPA: DUF885 family protein [Blastocatellia bacterium]|nr:DUF885 family protein [Blastocatellia bacterium]
MKSNPYPNNNQLTGRKARVRSRRSGQLSLLIALPLLITSFTAMAQQKKSSFADLTKLFAEWRVFQRPNLINGVPDYSVSAMSAQHRELSEFRRRLAAIDTSGWPVSHQVDWYIVRAEINGLDFDHRVLRPWANNPAFYVTVFFDQSDQPAREGPHAYGAAEIWQYRFPLNSDRAAELDAAVRLIPRLLEQARQNLVGKNKDLWVYGTREVREQSSALTRLAALVGDVSAEIRSDIERAKEATDKFVEWLEAQAPSKTAPSGIGIENYDWYLKNVQLVPYTWQQEVALMESDLSRANAFLALEEEKNKDRPQPRVVASEEEYATRFNTGVTEYMSFLKERDILTIKEYMDPALRARIGKFNPGPREFFGEVDYRDPEVMRTHGYHWFDLAQMEHEPHTDPIRRGPLLYNIFNTRTEGHATGWEELMMQAGMFDSRPRSRELIYILIAERAARALGELRMVSGEFTLEQAAEFTSHNTPRGWLSLKGSLVRAEQHLYLQQPGYGTSYLIGKKQIEMLLADRKMHLGDRFRMKQFMDSFNAAGLVPASLLRWELTGRMPDDVRRMLASR